MDFNKYYSDQTEGLNGFRGSRFQKGYGVGSMFRRFAKWAIPIIKQYATPVISKAIKSGVHEVSRGFNNFSNDINIDDKSIKESARHRIDETFNNIKNKIQNGGKRKPKHKSIKSKRCKFQPNIFEHDTTSLKNYKSTHQAKISKKNKKF